MAIPGKLMAVACSPRKDSDIQEGDVVGSVHSSTGYNGKLEAT